MLRESSPEQLAELLDEIAANFKDFKVFMAGEVGTNTRMGRLPVEALEQVLRDREGRVATERLYNWLGMFLDNGFRLLGPGHRQPTVLPGVGRGSVEGPHRPRHRNLSRKRRELR